MDYPKSVPSAGLVNGKFIDENPLTGTPGSLIPADWGNGVTQEILNVIKAGDLTPDEKKYDQLLQAIQNVSAKGWNLDSALPIGSLPTATVATPDGRLAITPAAVATSGGRISIPAGVLISLGQEVLTGQLARPRTFTTQAWSSVDLLPNSNYFLRAQVVAGVLTFYTQRGIIYDATPEGLKGTINGAAGGGFQTTPLDICLAWVVTAGPGSVPIVRPIYNRGRLSWTQTISGNGVVYLPLDPHARAARLVVGNATPHPTLVTAVNFATPGWLGANYCFLNPKAAASSNWDGWAIAGETVRVITNNEVSDTTVSTLTASFDHSMLRSLWQTYQAEHAFGADNGSSDELLFSMGIKNLLPSDYANGVALNFSAAVNINLSWELIR
ncbi:phage tail protein [Pseudomonas fluorescens]|uniref:Phage tail protein n=1 Tax=Pseudomonas fluorescens TaxID=294 RepID=A0A854X249_PSEFL|nr:phage tail protein [Pseudomonas fluorescens]PCM49711.1 phage tail protein [Pseudomonas fluorescens]